MQAIRATISTRYASAVQLPVPTEVPLLLVTCGCDTLTPPVGRVDWAKWQCNRMCVQADDTSKTVCSFCTHPTAAATTVCTPPSLVAVNAAAIYVRGLVVPTTCPHDWPCRQRSQPSCPIGSATPAHVPSLPGGGHLRSVR
jgi:hypothetical protein